MSQPVFVSSFSVVHLGCEVGANFRVRNIEAHMHCLGTFHALSWHLHAGKRCRMHSRPKLASETYDDCQIVSDGEAFVETLYRIVRFASDGRPVVFLKPSLLAGVAGGVVSSNNADLFSLLPSTLLSFVALSSSWSQLWPKAR